MDLALAQVVSPSGGVRGSLTELSRLVKEAADRGADAIVFPELFLGGYVLGDEHLRANALSLDGPELSQEVPKVAREHGIAVILGFAEKVADSAESAGAGRGASGGPATGAAAETGHVYCNSAIAFGPDGRVLQVYRKTHLFGKDEKKAFRPGGELGAVFSIPSPRKKGRNLALKIGTVDAAGKTRRETENVCPEMKCALLICYDAEFPEAVRECALNGADLILVPTANFAPYFHINRALIPAQAVLNHVTLAYCNWSEHLSVENVAFCGESLIAAPLGPDGGPPPTANLTFSATEVGVKVGRVFARRSLDVKDAEFDYLRDRRPELYESRKSGGPGRLNC